MKLKTLVALTAISMTSIASASYNGIIYIPTSVKYDVERSLIPNLDFVRTRSHYVSYWSKSSKKDFCNTTEKTLSELGTEVSKLSNKFISESETFRHKGKSEINEAILNLDKVVRDGLSPITKSCKDSKRMKEDKARSLTSNMHDIKMGYFQARNKLARLISDYGEVIRVYGQANTANFNGQYVGNQGWQNLYAPCEVEIKVKGKEVNMAFKDENSSISITRDLISMSNKEEVLKNFSFDREIEANTICSAKGTTFANLNYENGSLKDFKITHRRLKRNASGFGTLISCISQDDEVLSKIFAMRYSCKDLERKK